MLFEEVGPLAGYQGSVSLKRVVDNLSGGIFLLKFHRFSIEVNTHDQRLASMPVECDFRDIISLDILFCEQFESILGHLRLKSIVDIRFIKIIAVLTVQIAQRSCRLYHQIESQRSTGVLHRLLQRDCIFKRMSHINIHTSAAKIMRKTLYL